MSYLKEQIIQHVKDNDFGMQIYFSVEEEPLGTGGAIKRAFNLCKNKNVFVVNGDTFFDVDLTSMMNFALTHNVDITVATKKMINFERYGTLKIENDFVIEMNEKMPCDVGYINGGIYCLRRDFLIGIPQEKFSFEKDILDRVGKVEK